jgi:ribosomal protein L37AE/L43A
MKKYRSMDDIMARARYVVVEKEDYSNTMCEQCGSGDNPEELLLCDKCDNGFHMKCVRPIVARIPIGPWICPKCSGTKKVTGRRFIHSLHFWNCFSIESISQLRL